MIDHHMKASPCSNCGHILDMAASTTGQPRAPKEGDATICIKCGGLSIYAADLRLRKPTLIELAALLEDPRVQQAQAVLHEVKSEPQYSGTYETVGDAIQLGMKSLLELIAQIKPGMTGVEAVPIMVTALWGIEEPTSVLLAILEATEKLLPLAAMTSKAKREGMTAQETINAILAKYN